MAQEIEIQDLATYPLRKRRVSLHLKSCVLYNSDEDFDDGNEAGNESDTDISTSDAEVPTSKITESSISCMDHSGVELDNAIARDGTIWSTGTPSLLNLLLPIMAVAGGPAGPALAGPVFRRKNAS